MEDKKRAVVVRPGDVLRVVKSFVWLLDLPAGSSQKNPKSAYAKITINEGQLLPIVGVIDKEVWCALKVSAYATQVDVKIHFLIDDTISADAFEILHPVGGEYEIVSSDKSPEKEEKIEMPDKNDCANLRYSKANIQATTKRPEVFLYQGALKAVGAYDGAIDGWYGKGSAEAVEKFQDDNGLSADGVIGRGTATKIITQAEAAGFVPDLNLRIMSVIAFYEVSNRRNAFGMAENDIGDGAGANYGIFQCNSYGSVITMLKLAGRDDLVRTYNSLSKKEVNPAIQDWFGSSEGIGTQIKFFEEKTIKGALRELRDFGLFDVWENDTAMKTWWERAVLLFCDSRIQNGTMWSGSRRPFWKDLVGAERYGKRENVPELYHGTWWDEQLGQHVQYEDFKKQWWAEYETQKEASSDLSVVRKATTKAVARKIVENIPDSDPQAKLLVLAQIRARSSWEKYWFQAVASRRITDVTGNSSNHPDGVVNGEKVDLVCDYQI